MKRTIGLLAAGAYVGAVLAANWATAHLGFIPVGFGLTAIAGTYAAGATFILRDFVQDTLGRRVVLAAIVVGAVLSAAVSPTQLALASGITFLLSEAADFAVYTPLRSRGWARAVLASNTVGFVFDSFLFLWLAGFPIASTVTGQIVGKAWATVLPVAAVAAYRAMRRPEPEVAA
jgi:uncharacterized PurR-regulated membrane protein YhhQ (DUF165 family)